MILQGQVFVWTVILLIALLLLVIACIYLLVRYQHTKPVIEVSLLLVFLSGFTFCRLMIVVILKHQAEEVFEVLSWLFLDVGFLAFVVFIINIYQNRRELKKGLQKPPDITKLLAVINDSILIYDHTGAVYYVNHESKIRELFGEENLNQTILKSRFIQYAAEELTEEIELCFNNKNHELTFEIGITSLKSQFMVTIAPIVAGTDSVVGSIVILHDISKEKSMMQEIDIKNNNLEVLNQQLIKETKAAQSLAMEKERLRILEMLQNDLIHRIESIVKSISVAEHKQYDSVGAFQSEVAVAEDQLRDVYKRIRQTIQNIYVREGEANDNSSSCR